jgi:hypothetical protein
MSEQILEILHALLEEEEGQDFLLNNTPVLRTPTKQKGFIPNFLVFGP